MKHHFDIVGAFKTKMASRLHATAKASRLSMAARSSLGSQETSRRSSAAMNPQSTATKPPSLQRLSLKTMSFNSYLNAPEASLGASRSSPKRVLVSDSQDEVANNSICQQTQEQGEDNGGIYLTLRTMAPLDEETAVLVMKV